jgi:hypothetical protein
LTLDEARHVGDPPADALIATLGKDVWIVNAALRHVHMNGEPLPPAVPEAVRRFFTEHAALPDGFDHVAAERAQRWASKHLFEITAALFCASLPVAYAAAKGARVLDATARMHGKELDRRVNETAQFVLDIITPRAFAPDGAGLRAIQKVRLVHAAVRAHLLTAGGQDEMPINQEDLLGTLGTFSVVVIRSMRRLGVEVSAETADDFYQLWRGVGAMLGIERELLPRSAGEAEQLCDRIARRQHQGSEHGRALMASLLEGMTRHASIFPTAPAALVRHLVGDTIADMVGVPRDEGAQDRLALMRLLPKLPLSATAVLSRVVGRTLLETVVAAKLHGEPATFAMPLRVGARERS